MGWTNYGLLWLHVHRLSIISGATGLCWSGMCVQKLVKETLIMFASPQPKLGPNLSIFSLSSGASPAHDAGGRVLPFFSQQIFLKKEVDKRDGKMIVAHYPPLYMGSFGCCALDSCVC